MNLKHWSLWTLAACSFLFSACDDDEETLAQINSVSSVEAAIDTACSDSLNFIGTHVFAYIDSNMAFGKHLMIGGYTSGDTKELGLMIPWPVDTGNLPAFNLYYDPLNNDNDPNDADDQYGATVAVPSVDARIESVTWSPDSSTIVGIEVRLNCLPIERYTNGTMETLFLDNLVIKR